MGKREEGSKVCRGREFTGTGRKDCFLDAVDDDMYYAYIDTESIVVCFHRYAVTVGSQ